MPGQWPLDIYPQKVIQASHSGNINPYNGGCFASVTPHTKGDWNFSTFLPMGATHLLFGLAGNAVDNTDTSGLMDLGIEAPGQGDRVVIPNIQVGYASIRQSTFLIPINVPRESYIAFRCQSAIASKGYICVADVYGGEGSPALSLPQKYTDYGTNLATSSATPVTPGQTGDTFGSWTEITAATTAPIHEIWVTVQGIGTVVPDGLTAVDIAIGAAGSEIPIASKISFNGNTNDESIKPLSPNVIWPQRFNIPAGVRLSARAATQFDNSPDISVQVMGVTY